LEIRVIIWCFIIALIFSIIQRSLNMLLKKKRFEQHEKMKKLRYLSSGMSSIDMMEGVEFEEFLKYLYEELGYRAELTQNSHDKGVDLILYKDGKKGIVQAKRYKGSVGIDAVREIVTAIKIVGADYAYVVTNSRLTSGAVEAARANDVMLIDRTELKKLMKKAGMKEKAEDIIKATISENKCPKCESELKLRHSKYGDFYGCSNYPKCDFTRNLN